MARINLLPWRQEVRERKNREFLTLVMAVFFLSLLGAFAAWSYYKNTLESQQLANERIKQENANLDKALKEIDSLEQQRDDIIARMKVIQDLQGRRPIPVRVWDDIARIIPSQMYLTKMTRVGDVITFTGQADNPNVISTFIRSLDGTQWLEKSAVVYIQQPNAVAYQDKKPAQATNPNTNQANPEQEKPNYPELNYVTFEVTTMVKQTQVASGAASTTVPSSATASSAR